MYLEFDVIEKFGSFGGNTHADNSKWLVENSYVCRIFGFDF